MTEPRVGLALVMLQTRLMIVSFSYKLGRELALTA